MFVFVGTFHTIFFFFYKHQMKADQLGHLGGDKAWLADRLTVIAA